MALSDRHVCRREGARETREAARQERVRPAVASTRMARARSTPPAHVEPATGRPPLTPPTLTTLFGFSICHISPFSTINTISSSLLNYVTIFDKKKNFLVRCRPFLFFFVLLCFEIYFKIGIKNLEKRKITIIIFFGFGTEDYNNLFKNKNVSIGIKYSTTY